MADQTHLDDLASAVAEGSRIDWGLAEQSARDGSELALVRERDVRIRERWPRGGESVDDREKKRRAEGDRSRFRGSETNEQAESPERGVADDARLRLQGSMSSATGTGTLETIEPTISAGSVR